MKKRGFTLIELLAVLIILAVIALISVPIVLNIIESARKSAFIDSAYGLIESAKVTYTENLMDGKSEGKTYLYPFDDLKFSGSKPSGGMIRIDLEGNVEIAIYNGKWCALKKNENSKVEIKNYDEATCKLEDIETSGSKTFTEQMESTKSEVASLDPDHNLRYVGKNPNNYVKFNNELWRIIGVFDGQAKIVREELYSTDIVWDKNEENGGTHGVYGYNDWSRSTLQEELNGTYFNHIDQTSQSYIDATYLWKLGGANNDSTTWTRSSMYEKERGTVVFNNHPTEWSGAIGLMYPSDYGYATSSTESYCDLSMYDWSSSDNSECKDNNWIFHETSKQWLLTPRNTNSANAFTAFPNGMIGTNIVGNYLQSVRPTLYLKSEVKIVSGSGTSTNPFLLGL